MNRNGVDADLDAEWTYDNDGKLVTVRYPLGAVYQHGYDEMGRPKTMIDAGTQTTVIGSATYGPAGELLTMGNETRQYNSRLQVTRITYPTQDWEYKYSATQNNGQITSMKDWTSGEEVNYAYDELKRLSSAVTVGPEWGNSYVYDGFGNLLQKNVVKGTAPYMNLSIDPATNKPYSGYSAAGLPTSGAGFDNDNRMISTTAGSSYQEYYAYSPAGKRVWNRGKRDIEGTWVDKEEVWFWGVTGQRMAFYALTASGNPVFTLTSTNLYMGSKLVMSGGAAVKTDRLGSVGKFYPWGEERTPTGASGEKFATYYHDVQAAMNYADQRWHGTNGRFQVPDPYQASAGAGDPGSWNRFAYVQGDPVNRIDRRGLFASAPDCGPGSPDGECLIDSGEGPITWDCWALGNCGPWRPTIDLPSEVLEIDELPGTQGFLAGQQAAHQALSKKDCFDMLGFKTAELAQSFLKNGVKFVEQYRGRLELVNGQPKTKPAPAFTTGTGVIVINLDYNWNDFSKVTTSKNTTFNYLAFWNTILKTSMTSEQLATLIIIHELRHQLTIPNTSDDESDKAKRDIYDKCIK